MEETEDSDALLVLTEMVLRHEDDVAQMRKEIHRLLVEEEWRAAMRSRHSLTVECLNTPAESAWMSLYMHGSDKNFLNATSLTRATFNQLLGRFAGFYSTRAAPSRGRPPKLRSLHQVLGMLLCFYVGSMKKNTLCMLFGVPPATLARTLRKAEDALSVALQGYAPARIAFPSPSQQAKLAKLVEGREPLLKYTFGFIDGKNLRVSG
ncbi:hypothetical protein PF008_g30986 [Phytophthora fragariae]|uniref:DDE Tnp4 domain-containing protein n=1 Tax=Phytophthora fragariae TaxID=53985 RepID=A0A6G0Q423_9STRA|nr:hypothetical protein PF008_g30986 [Phytophthora fragariae]